MVYPSAISGESSSWQQVVALPCPALPCLALPCPALPCLALSFCPHTADLSRPLACVCSSQYLWLHDKVCHTELASGDVTGLLAIVAVIVGLVVQWRHMQTISELQQRIQRLRFRLAEALSAKVRIRTALHKQFIQLPHGLQAHQHPATPLHKRGVLAQQHTSYRKQESTSAVAS